MEFKAGGSEETFRLLERAQDLESQRQKKTSGWERTLRSMARAYLDKFDPVEKAKRVMKRNSARAEFINDALEPKTSDTRVPSKSSKKQHPVLRSSQMQT